MAMPVFKVARRGIQRIFSTGFSTARRHSMVMKATRVTGLALACAGVLAAGASGCSTRALNIYVPSRNVDILFVVDDSSKTARLQRNLIMNFPILMQRLEDPPGLADLHLAVVSTDMGAGDGSIAGCDANGGKNGVFQYAPRGTCGATASHPARRTSRTSAA